MFISFGPDGLAASPGLPSSTDSDSMQRITLSFMLAFGISAAPLAIGAAQTRPDTIKQIKRPPSTGIKIAKRLADTAATAAAGAGVQSLLGKRSIGVANALGVGARSSPCGRTGTTSDGAAIVGVAKGAAKKATDPLSAAASVPCPQAAQIPGGFPGMPSAAYAGTAMGGAGASGMPAGGMGMVAGMTPIGLAIGAAPGAIKGVKGLLGGKAQDKIAMLRELGKGKLELKGVKFIEGTAELEPGYEPSLAALGEAISLAEGTYLLHVAAEVGEKGTSPDTALARKRIEKIWAAILVNGVSDQRLIAAGVLPQALQAGRKPPKHGKALIELIRLPSTP